MMTNNKVLNTLLIICVTIFIFCGSNVNAQKDTIVWRANYKLSWSDFQGRPQSKTSHGAVADTGIKAPCRITKNDVMDIEVFSVFFKSSSWTRTEEQTDEALAHEQGHFDIAEIAARKLRMRMINQKFKKRNALKTYRKLVDAVSKEMFDMHELYDQETDHHRNKSQQKKWDNKIRNELKELEDFQQRHFRIEL